MGTRQLSARWMCRRRGTARSPLSAGGAPRACWGSLGCGETARHRLAPCQRLPVPPAMRQSVYPAVSPRTGDLQRTLMERRARRLGGRGPGAVRLVPGARTASCPPGCPGHTVPARPLTQAPKSCLCGRWVMLVVAGRGCWQSPLLPEPCSPVGQSRLPMVDGNPGGGQAGTLRGPELRGPGQQEEGGSPGPDPGWLSQMPPTAQGNSSRDPEPLRQVGWPGDSGPGGMVPSLVAGQDEVLGGGLCCPSQAQGWASKRTPKGD